jgi:hypothetical protein
MTRFSLTLKYTLQHIDAEYILQRINCQYPLKRIKIPIHGLSMSLNEATFSVIPAALAPDLINVIPNAPPKFVAPGLTCGPATLIFRKPEIGNP